MRRRLLLIGNARAGRGHSARVEKVRAALERAGARVDLIAAGTAAEARRLTAEACSDGIVDAVLAAGGDGTIRDAAIAAAARGVPVGIIPAGTGNVMAREIALPWRPEAIAATILDGDVIEICGGIANGEPFFLWAGAGFDGRVVGHLDQGLKRRLGRLAFGTAILRALGEAPDHLCVEIDGERHTGSWVIISNAARYGGGFRLTDQTRLTKRGLIAVVVRHPTRSALLAAQAALAVGLLPRLAARGRGIVAVPVTRATIATADGRSLSVEIDGDAVQVPRLEVRDGGPILRLIVPPATRSAPR